MHRVQIYKLVRAWHGREMDMPRASQAGARERKRRDTHRRITETALRLFMEQGYEATTLDAIAAEAGIARRTFFHYFRSKEEIILAWQGALPEALHDAVLQQSRGVGPIVALERALVSLSKDMDPDVAVSVSRIVRSDKQLQSSNQAKFLAMEHAAYEALRRLWLDDADREAVRLVAMIGVGAMRLAIDDWSDAQGARPLETYLADIFRTLEKASERPA